MNRQQVNASVCILTAPHFIFGARAAVACRCLSISCVPHPLVRSCGGKPVEMGSATNAYAAYRLRRYLQIFISAPCVGACVVADCRRPGFSCVLHLPVLSCGGKLAEGGCATDAWAARRLIRHLQLFTLLSLIRSMCCC